MPTSILSLALAIWLTHSWYPESCCAGHDCNPVPCEDLSELNDGSVRYRGSASAPKCRFRFIPTCCGMPAAIS